MLKMFELKIMYWNCNANLRLRYEGYDTYHKVRSVNPNFRGGVAVLINSRISHRLIDNLDNSFEIIGLTIEMNNLSIDILSYYNPPGLIISSDVFANYLESGKKFLLLGDLNSKSKSIGCSFRF